MGLLDRLLGRTAPPKPDLDRIFGLTDAALTLQTTVGFRPTGAGAVCFRNVEGGAFADVTRDVQQLLDADAGPPVERSDDRYGFTWLLLRHDATELSALVTELHAVNSSLEDHGFGPMLLCSTVGFRDDTGRRLALVYLYKRGTFYPFAPLEGERRDSALELQVRAAVADDIPLEADLARWFPVWGAPGV